jgi:hypothetical protein
MIVREVRESLLNEITILQGQQLTMHQEASIRGWTPQQSLRAFDARLARMTLLVRQLAELDEPDRIAQSLAK